MRLPSLWPKGYVVQFLKKKTSLRISLTMSQVHRYEGRGWNVLQVGQQLTGLLSRELDSLLSLAQPIDPGKTSLIATYESRQHQPRNHKWVSQHENTEERKTIKKVDGFSANPSRAHYYFLAEMNISKGIFGKPEKPFIFSGGHRHTSESRKHRNPYLPALHFRRRSTKGALRWNIS